MERLNIAVIGTGISGLSAAWLLAQNHNVTLFEKGARLGGHTHTNCINLDDGPCNVDTGFIVYNPAAYPNLVELFRHLDIDTSPSNMSFAVARKDRDYEYSGSGLKGLFGQSSNLLSPGHWRLIFDILKFFSCAKRNLGASRPDASVQDGNLARMSLRDYCEAMGMGPEFIEDHIKPMAAAIWSTPENNALDFPALSFVRFFFNHGLLEARNRPEWRTVTGGSKNYIAPLVKTIEEIHLNTCICSVERKPDSVFLTDDHGNCESFDHVVIGAHADDTLKMLSYEDADEVKYLGAFAYSRNEAFLHSDPSFMPRRKNLWSSWNYVDFEKAHQSKKITPPSITYWMNRLQPLATSQDLFVTLNPSREIDGTLIHNHTTYNHPLFDQRAINAQKHLWSIQGRRRTWFCGSYFGYGFHEDGLQSGLAVAEQLGGANRPWDVPDQMDRVQVDPATKRFGATHYLEAAE